MSIFFSLLKTRHYISINKRQMLCFNPYIENKIVQYHKFAHL